MQSVNEGLTNYRKSTIGGKETIVHRDYSQPARAGKSALYFNKGKRVGSQQASRLRPIERYNQSDPNVIRAVR